MKEIEYKELQNDLFIINQKFADELREKDDQITQINQKNIEKIKLKDNQLIDKENQINNLK